MSVFIGILFVISLLISFFVARKNVLIGIVICVLLFFGIYKIRTVSNLFIDMKDALGTPLPRADITKIDEELPKMLSQNLGTNVTLDYDICQWKGRGHNSDSRLMIDRAMLIVNIARSFDRNSASLQENKTFLEEIEFCKNPITVRDIADVIKGLPASR